MYRAADVLPSGFTDVEPMGEGVEFPELPSPPPPPPPTGQRLRRRRP